MDELAPVDLEVTEDDWSNRAPKTGTPSMLPSP